MSKMLCQVSESIIQKAKLPDLATHFETWFDVKLVDTWMHTYALVCDVIVCMSARKKAPVNLLMCPFQLYMFIGVSMQLRVVFVFFFSSDPILLVGCP